MSGYVDLAAEAATRRERAAFRRRRLLTALRGWLRESGSPKRAATVAIVVTAVVAVAIGRGCVVAGLAGPALASAIAVLASWPLFLFILWRYAGAKWDAVPENHYLRRLLTMDHASLVAEKNTTDNASEWTELREVWESGRQTGASGFFVLTLHAVLTGGIWLIYDFIRISPALLAEIAADGVLAAREPALMEKVETYPWPRYAVESTAPYFFGLAVAAWAITGIIQIF